MHPTSWAVGRQFIAQGPVGLLVDNQRLALQGASLSQQHGDVGFGAFFGMASTGELNETFEDAVAGGGQLTREHLLHNDGYASARLQWDVCDDWTVGGNYLVTGMGEEDGWSVDVDATLFDRRLVAEYSRLSENAYGGQEGSSGPYGYVSGEPEAWYVSYELLNEGCANFTGYYSKADFGYNPFYSVVNPYYELLQPRLTLDFTRRNAPWFNTGYAWERWLDNPVVAHNLEAIGGYLDFDLGQCPVELGYHHLLSRDAPMSALGQMDGEPGLREPLYDKLWSARVTSEITDGVNVTFTYAHQEPNDDFSDDGFFIPEMLNGFPSGAGFVVDGLQRNLTLLNIIEGGPFDVESLEIDELDLFMASLEIAF
jgi:hypothetical protein